MARSTKVPAICSYKPSLRWNWINSFFVFIGLSTSTLGLAASSEATKPGAEVPVPVFRLHLSGEPSHLDPQKQKSSSSSYLVGNLFRNIYQFDDEKGLVPDLGTSCKNISKTILECKLKKNLHWSDGSDLTSADFLRTYQKILDPKNSVFRADLLFKIKNAREIFNGEKKELGISAPDKFTLRFEFAQEDGEFEYNLASLPLSPSKDDPNLASGPYKIKSWQKGQKITLEKNDFYPDGDARRPLVEFLFIEEDSVALQLYEKNELQLLRRLPTLYIPQYKNRKDFQSIPVTRFDYVGFGPELQGKEKAAIREAFIFSLNYPELQKIFSSPGVPGCAGLPASWFEGERPCFRYDKDKALLAVQKIAPGDKSRTYSFLLSSLGGEDHKRLTEWAQGQWQKVGLKINPQIKENKVYLSQMKTDRPALFRKGIAVDRPSCLAALETFMPENPENYLHLDDPNFAKIVTALRKTRSEADKKKYCSQGVHFLMDNYLLIPLGQFDFSMLIKPEFVGWKFNQMNQLDLARLHKQ